MVDLGGMTNVTNLVNNSGVIAADVTGVVQLDKN